MSSGESHPIILKVKCQGLYYQHAVNAEGKFVGIQTVGTLQQDAYIFMYSFCVKVCIGSADGMNQPQ